MRPPSSAPSVTSWPTIRGSFSSPIFVLSPTSMPKPFRKPWSRCTSTETPSGLRSSMAIFASLPPSRTSPSPTGRSAGRPGSCRSRTWRRRRPAARSGVSSAITSSPAWRALSSDGTIALESFGVIRMPFAPAEIRFSTAATWLSLSPSFLPANDCSSAPSSSALALRALLHLHEERVGLGLGDQADGDVAAAAAAAAAPLPPPSSSPHAATPAASASTRAGGRDRARAALAEVPHSSSSPLAPRSRRSPSAPRQRFQA